MDYSIYRISQFGKRDRSHIQVVTGVMDRCCAPTQEVFGQSGATSAPPNQNPNNPPANSEPEGAASENEPHSPAGQVESIEDAPPGAPHNERTLRNAQSVYNVLNAVLGFTGLMSGFEGV